MADSNVQLNAAFLYWLYAYCPRNDSKSCHTYKLLEMFNQCMEETGLAPKLGYSAFELLLEYSELQSHEQQGVTYWIGLDDREPDPLGQDRYHSRSFPEIFR
jgi:hypothetical protein